MFISYPCGKDVVEQVLPHRDPFVWVTRVLECQPGRSIAAELDVDPALPLFAGHFPQHPVLPGVIIMEALAQAASFCMNWFSAPVIAFSASAASCRAVCRSFCFSPRPR